MLRVLSFFSTDVCHRPMLHFSFFFSGCFAASVSLCAAFSLFFVRVSGLFFCCLSAFSEGFFGVFSSGIVVNCYVYRDILKHSVPLCNYSTREHILYSFHFSMLFLYFKKLTKNSQILIFSFRFHKSTRRFLFISWAKIHFLKKF